MKKIMDIYYQIWVDCLLRMKAQEKNKPNDWKVWSMIMMSVAMMLNLMLFMSILQEDILSISFYYTNFPIPDKYNGVFDTLLLFALPVVVVNYLLIFRNKKYEKLIEKYPYRNGKLAVPYVVISLLLPVVLVFILVVFIQ